MSESWIKIQNEPVKAMRRLDLKLCASKRIVNDNGLTMFSVTGNQQGGKSAYGMCILSEIYENDVDEILRHIVMTAGDFAKMIMNAIDGGYRERCIMWDDMSVSGSAATWMTDPKFVKALGGLGDTMAVATKSVLLTSPSGDTIKAFRNYSKYNVQIKQGSGKYGRIAKGYWIGTSPMGEMYCSSEFDDLYDVRIPFYEQYADKRRRISIQAAKEMMKLTQQTEEQESYKPSTKDRILEILRDISAGIHEGKEFLEIIKGERIDPSYANKIKSQYKGLY